MSKVFAVLMVLAVACSAVSALRGGADTEVDTEVPTRPPRKGKTLVNAKLLGPSFGNQKVVMVPKGDPRAQAPVEAPKPRKPQEPRVIVEADSVEPVEPVPVRDVEIVDAAPAPGSITLGGDGSATATNDGTIVVVPGGAPSGGAVVPGVAPGGAVVPGVAPRPLLKGGAPLLRASAPNPGACLAGYNGASAAAMGKRYQATYRARGTKYSQPKREFGINAKYADCSSFVTSILADMNMNCLFAAGRYTSYMNQEIRKRGGYSKTANLGDIVMWGSHTGLIVEVCRPGVYSMVAMGNSGAGFARCLTPGQIAGWGSGGFLGFWRPRA